MILLTCKLLIWNKTWIWISLTKIDSLSPLKFGAFVLHNCHSAITCSDKQLKVTSSFYKYQTLNSPRKHFLLRPNYIKRWGFHRHTQNVTCCSSTVKIGIVLFNLTRKKYSVRLFENILNKTLHIWMFKEIWISLTKKGLYHLWNFYWLKQMKICWC